MESGQGSPQVQCLPHQGLEQLRGPRHRWEPWVSLGSREEWSDQCPVVNSMVANHVDPMGGRQGWGQVLFLTLTRHRCWKLTVTGNGKERNHTCPLPGPGSPPDHGDGRGGGAVRVPGESSVCRSSMEPLRPTS